MTRNLISIEQAKIFSGEQLLFENLDFQWNQGQQWAILGNSGVEQTAFLNTLLGNNRIVEGKIERPFASAYQVFMSQEGHVNSFRDLMATVSQKYIFKNKSNLQNFYYQQRFNSMESEEAVTVNEYLEDPEGFRAEEGRRGYWDKEKVIQLLHLEELTNKSLIKLSNGETRRLAIAAALIKNPHLLLLDQPMTGLDKETRETFGEILQAVVDSGIHLLMATTPTEIPECISHIALLENKKLKSAKLAQSKELQFSKIRPTHVFDSDLLQDLIGRNPDLPFRKMVEMKNVSIRYDRKEILHQVNWTVLSGERWALKGPNGAGKSTLLSLILGENPQAYANHLVLFDRRRGTGESIWDIKKHIGFVAPELSRYFPTNQTCLKVVLSGLFDTMGLFRKVNQEQESLAKKWLTFLGIEGTGEKLLQRVSLDQQRFILLARAMIKVPALLILDEATQGMDALQKTLFKSAVDKICSEYPLSMIHVSHYEEDIPKAVTKQLRLEKGKVIQKAEENH
jgi:molybdate transport system ATP-binding protein